MSCLLNRTSTGPDGTFGDFTNLATGKKWKSGELEWLNNTQDISCIPPGTYMVRWLNHPKHGWCYEVTNVPNRIAILIHSGNYAGQESLGEKTDFLGCIGLGETLGVVVPPGFTHTQETIQSSKQAIGEFEADMKQGDTQQDFELTIVNSFEAVQTQEQQEA